MWLRTCKMSFFQCALVSSPSSVCKCMIAVLAFSIVATSVSLNHSYIFFTSTCFIMCTIFFTLFFNQNPKQLITNHEQEVRESCSDAKVFECKYSEVDNTSDDDEDDEDDDVHDNYVTRSALSSEDDGTISDEDTLIELELPTGHYLSHERYNKLISSKQTPEWMWMELLSEANSELATDEDNFIEIDISIGSIMCPRFEIQT